MATLQELQARREELAKRRYSGVAVVVIDGKRIEYRSQAEIERAIEALDREIESAAGRTPVRAVRVSGSKGL